MRARIAKLALIGMGVACGGRGAEADSSSATALADSTSRAADSASAAGAAASMPPGRASTLPPVGRTGGPPATSPPAPRDTIRGIISLVGADPRVWVRMVTLSRGTMQFTGPHERALAGLSGAEVWVAGKVVETDFGVTTFNASDFAVRSVDGLSAVDGVLVDRNGALSVSVPDGTSVAIRSAPDALRAHIGKRVWVTLSSGDVQSFGVIDN